MEKQKTYNFEKYPTLEEAKKSIKRLNKIKWPEYINYKSPEDYIKEIENIIFSEFEIFPNIKRFFTPNEFLLPIFRVREVNSFSNINLFTEHSYPPINFTKFGRCNFPNHPVFYCSNNPMTAVLEVIRNSDYKNKIFCISKWELIKSDNKFAFESFLQTNLHPDNQFSILRDKEFDDINKPFENKLSDDQKSGMREFIKFLHNSFINDSEYSISASLAHRAIYSGHNYSTDILLYASVQSASKGVNMAINPNFVDNNMFIKRFYFIEIVKYDKHNGEIEVKFSKYGDVVKNVIIWKNIRPDDEIYKEYMHEDFKDQIVFDKGFEMNS